jgi:stearoyl-CoA desaturase (delta-9 desaturase)
MTETSVPTAAESAVNSPPPASAAEMMHKDENSWAYKLAILLVIILPFVGVVAAPFFVWGWGFSWVDLGLLVGFYCVTTLGVTVGFHRLFTHKSFETNIVVKAILGIMGSLAIEGSLLKWVAMHRRHHQHSDTEHDPHSPHNHGDSLWGFIRGFFHSHLGWLLKGDPANLSRYVADLRKSKTLRVVSMLFPLWVFLTMLIPAALGGLFTWSWQGCLTGFIWGGLVRVFLVHHVTWSVNSACHLWGRRTFRSNDESRNNFVFGVLAMGEGWHNTHHAFPTSARHGLRWWEIDVSYGIIRFLSWIGLAWNVQIPSKVAVEQKRSA